MSAPAQPPSAPLVFGKAFGDDARVLQSVTGNSLLSVATVLCFVLLHVVFARTYYASALKKHHMYALDMVVSSGRSFATATHESSGKS